MRSRRRTAVAAAVVAVWLGATPPPGLSLQGSEPTVEQEIGALRATSNRAIRERDLERLQSTWLPEIVVTASRGDVLDGPTMAGLFAQDFADPEFVSYVRTPTRIRVGPGGSIAAEEGEWTGRWKRSDGEMVVSGTYLAQWHRRADGWRIRSELFVALDCSGSAACDQLP